MRGGIIDIYPLTEDNPWRIELWDDEVDSIRSFDPESQRSLENLEELTIYPAVEHIGDKDMVSFLDYFPEERTIIFLDEPNRLTEAGLEKKSTDRAGCTERKKAAGISRKTGFVLLNSFKKN